MSDYVKVFKDRTTTVPVSLGFDVSNDIITSQIRVSKDKDSELIATWDVSFLTDGTDGELILVMDNSNVTDLAYDSGWMDLKRVTAGEPVPVFSKAIRVRFEDSVTV